MFLAAVSYSKKNFFSRITLFANAHHDYEIKYLNIENVSPLAYSGSTLFSENTFWLEAQNENNSKKKF